MRITKLSLTNFRSFKETQTIEFAPVTLLFGPNSVGKSTVLMALFYLQGILTKGQCNPQRIEALGDKFVGGFEGLVFGKDITKTIMISVEYDKGSAIGKSYADLIDFIDYDMGYPLSSPIIDAQKILIEIEIAGYRDNSNKVIAYVKKYRVSFDGDLLIGINSDSEGKQPFITGINYAHSCFLGDSHNEFIKEQLDCREPIHDANYSLLCDLMGMDIPSHRDITKGEEIPFQELIDNEEIEFNDSSFFSPFHMRLNDGREGVNPQKLVVGDYKFIHVPLAIKGNKGALPQLNHLIKSNLDNESEQVCRALEEVLSDMLVAPLDNLNSLLAESLCIGPLRNIPDATFQPNPYPQTKDWYTGLAAWDLLANSDQKILSAINGWVSDKDKLDLGIGFAVKHHQENVEYKRVNTNDYFSFFDNRKLGEEPEFDSMERSLNEKQNEITRHIENYQYEGEEFINKIELLQLCESLILDSQTYVGMVEKEITPMLLNSTNNKFTNVLWDLKNKIEVFPADLGVGVSQLMPLIVASQTIKKGIVSIEQPELHVHPKVQVGIGDLLTQNDSNAIFLVETHSEHLILRMLRRIRETNNNELPEGMKPLLSKDVNVICLENSSEGVVVSKLNITDDGDFEEEWPEGFFDERDEELF